MDAFLPEELGILMAQQQPARRKMQPVKTPVSIPDKLYFRIGDVARLCGLPAYVLRFWETEFPQLKPHKGGSGQRLYRKRDVEMVLEIKRLLYGEGFTIAGAANRWRRNGQRPAMEPQKGTRRTDASKTDPAACAAGAPGRWMAAVTKVCGGRSKFNELRKEMRALLSMLGSEGGEKSAESRSMPLVASRRKKKARERADEPTLF